LLGPTREAVHRARDPWQKILSERVKTGLRPPGHTRLGDENEIDRREILRRTPKDFFQQSANPIPHHSIPDLSTDRAPEPRMRSLGIRIGDDRERFGLCAKSVALDARKLSAMSQARIARERPTRADLDAGARGHVETYFL